MAGEPKVTTDHKTIREWIESRSGKPSVVKNTEDKGTGVGLLRVNFPGYSGEESLEEISREVFFNTFEKKKPPFFKFVSRDSG